MVNAIACLTAHPLTNHSQMDTMNHILIRVLLALALACCLPIFASAATNYTLHAEWTNYTAPSGLTVSGFKLYQEDVFACQTTVANATSMDCPVSLTADTTNFALAATFTDGTESPKSAPVAFVNPSGTAALKAAITTNTTSGPAPLSISFSATSSTGAIVSYLWNFGDGGTATGNTATHAYATAGSYIAKLTVTDTAGLTNIASTTVTVTASTTTTTPPTAVISSSAAAGQAPLTVTFNGSGSTSAATATIASYAWSFSDGSSATGASASHAFTAAGTYSTTLTVTDSKGLTSSASTPIVVTAPVTTTNKAPTAAASATPATGPAPLTVTFDASASTDADGTIASYLWTFGDGSTATGKTATHTYTTAATFSAALKVTDNQGATGSTSKTITAQAQQQTTGLNIESGEVAVTDKWVRVPLTSKFSNPIVVAGPPSFKNNDPCVVRIRNVNATGFDIKVAEWNYLDGTHPSETVSYLVLEQGRTTLPDGSSVEAGSFSGTTRFKTRSFSKSFAKKPVIITTVASENETDTISGRIKNIGLSSFDYHFTEQQKNYNIHANEIVNFIAWESGKGTVGSIQFEAATTAQAVTGSWYTGTFQKPFTQAPLLLADMQTTADTEPTALRALQVTTTGFQVKAEEEASKYSNVTHGAETVGYLALNPVTQQTSPTEQTSTTIWPSTSVPATVDAGSDGAQELGMKFRSDVNGYITGIRFYKASTNTGIHVANLWTSTGTRLATTTFTNETESGWQEVNFSTPVAITANTVYVASYFCPAGHQSVDRNYFENKGMDSAPLHALASGVSGANGVYAYGSSSVFPNSSYLNTNYWVDVMFQP